MEEFKEQTRVLAKRFVNKGYEVNSLNELVDQVQQTDRSLLLRIWMTGEDVEGS